MCCSALSATTTATQMRCEVSSTLPQNILWRASHFLLLNSSQFNALLLSRQALATFLHKQPYNNCGAFGLGSDRLLVYPAAGADSAALFRPFVLLICWDKLVLANDSSVSRKGSKEVACFFFRRRSSNSSRLVSSTITFTTSTLACRATRYENTHTHTHSSLRATNSFAAATRLCRAWVLT